MTVSMSILTNTNAFRQDKLLLSSKKQELLSSYQVSQSEYQELVTCRCTNTIFIGPGSWLINYVFKRRLVLGNPESRAGALHCLLSNSVHNNLWLQKEERNRGWNLKNRSIFFGFDRFSEGGKTNFPSTEMQYFSGKLIFTYQV